MSRVKLKEMSGVTRFAIHFLMSLIFIFLFTFCLWLIWITYFRASYDVGTAPQVYSSAMDEIAHGQQKMYEHFHNIDAAVLTGKESSSLCLECHGNYPHSKAPDVRSFLNAHAYFAACEVCHIQRKSGDGMEYKWLSDKDGKELTELKGKAGMYGGKIVPIIYQGGKMRRLDESTDKEFIEEFLKLRNTFNADQQAEAKLRIHKDISAKPVFCDDCHKKDGYLNFKELHYEQHVARRLEIGSVGKMVLKYKEFYLPTMFDPTMKYIERNKRKQEAERDKD